MLDFLKAEATAYTENGAVAHATSGSDCLDFFATVGALRHASDDEIILRFMRAFCENREYAVKLLFFARDIRGGLGERRVFRVILKWLAETAPEAVEKNLPHIAEFGRFDDLLALMDTRCEKSAVAFLKAALDADLAASRKGEAVSLLAKWLPSVNTSNTDAVRYAKKLSRAFGMTDAAYRKALSRLRADIRILENHLRQKDYTFDYEKQPSRAMLKYRKAFVRNDGERYQGFLEAVSCGKAKLHTQNVMPYELIDPYLESTWGGELKIKNVTPEEQNTLNVTWEQLPDYRGEGNILAIVDTSGSMYFDAKPLPASVAFSLGMYLAEHNTGYFKNHFIEFSARPQLLEIKGETFFERLRYLTTFNEIANTNLEAVFDLILKTAVKHRVPESELPEKLVILSDMEFDAAVSKRDRTVFDAAKAAYEEAGYRLPEIVFWNVASRNRHQPVRMHESGVALVSGVTPKLFELVARGIVDPYLFMMEIIESERYRAITV